MFYHHTKTKGDLAVLKSQLDLYEKGYMILTPKTEHAPFDLVAYKDHRFLRILVKHRHMTDKGTIYIKFSNRIGSRLLTKWLKRPHSVAQSHRNTKKIILLVPEVA